MKIVRSRSLVRHTVGIVVAAQLLCAVVLCGAAMLHEWHTRLRAFDTRLEGRSDSLLGTIQDAEDPEDNVMIDPTELNLPGEDVYAVYNQGGRLLGSSRIAPSALITRHGDAFRDVKESGTRYRVFEREGLRVIDRAENGGQGLRRPVTLVYASPDGSLWHEVLEAVRFYLVAIAFATGLTVFLVALLLKKALSPLSELAVAAGQLSPPALVFTAPRSVLQVRELRPLAEVLTDAVVRLRDAFRKEHQFVGDAAHELKTAVAVVRSSVQLLMLKRRTAEEYAAGLERVLQDTGRVEVLVAQMLQLASLEEDLAGAAPTVDLGELTATALEHLLPIAEERGVSLHFAQPSPVPVRLLPERALSLITNLVLNAVQHSASGGAVSVSLKTGEGKAALAVEDTGAGIDPKALPHIFDRFYREDRSRSRGTGGTGLGLSICKSIVDAAGGSILVESSPAHGTRVIVTFIAA